jgi:serine/threonine-protein kinase
VAVAAAVAAVKPWERPAVASPAPPLHISGDLGTSASLAIGPGGTIAASPDGSMIAFAGRSPAANPAGTLLYLRRLDQLEATPLPGTEGASGPFFSPDGRWIGFFASNKLKKIAVTGGAVATLADVVGARGADWNDAGTIVFQPGSSTGNVQMLAISANGGEATPMHSAYAGTADRWPQFLPGGRGVLYTSTRNNTALGFNDATLMVRPLGDGEATVVHRGGYFGRYLPSGHLTFIHDGTMFAAPFDLGTLQMTGSPVPVVEGVASDSSSGVAEAAVTAAGTLAYAPGADRSGINESPLAWIERSGATRPLRSAPSIWGTPKFSPDGRRLALTLNIRGQTDIWTYAWDTDTSTRFTFDPAVDAMPVWTPDGRRIAFASQRADGIHNLYWQRADGSGEAQRLTESPQPQLPGSWHPSGKFLAYHQGLGLDNKQDILALPIEGDEASGWKPGKPIEVVGGPFRKVLPVFSPDGRWLAYVSNESGRFEVYVRPFPGPGGKWQISSGGANEPKWSPTRRELYFRAAGTFMVVPYAVVGESFQAEKPRRWSPGSSSVGPPINYGTTYDVHPDGERFVVMPVLEAVEPAAHNRLVFVTNFFDQLRRVAPVAK